MGSLMLGGSVWSLDISEPDVKPRKASIETVTQATTMDFMIVDPVETIIETADICEEPETTQVQEEPEDVEMASSAFSNDDICLLALVTMAEAEGECEYGKRLVIDVILNRVDSECYPNTVYGVVYQPYQFSSMTNGRVDRCYVRDDIYNLVVEEINCRTNYDVFYFTAGQYSSYGTPLFSVENHYFCGR